MAKSKSTTPPPPAEHEKGFLALAGEAFVVLGEEIVEGKDKVVEVAGNKFTALKTAISNITHKKKAAPRKKAAPGKKATPTKKAAPAKKVVKKVAPKKSPVKKAVKKSPPKPAPKKGVKKPAKKR